MRKRECILAVPLGSEAECLKSLKEEESSERIQGWSKVTEEFGADFGSKCDSSKCFAEFKTVISFSWLCKSRKPP